MAIEIYYIQKVNGLKEKSDYLQIRDSHMSLLANTKLKEPYDGLTRFFNNNSDKALKIANIAKTLAFGELKKIEL